MNLASALGIKENPTPLASLKDLIAQRTEVPGGISGIYNLNPKVDDILEKYGAAGPDGVRMVVMGTIESGGSGCICSESAFLRALLRYVFVKEDMVIMDMEAGIEHLGRGTTKGMDVMLAVGEPGMRSIDTVRRIKKLGSDIGVTNILAAINKVHDDAGAKLVTEKLAEMGIPVLGSIPYDENLINADMSGAAPLDVGGNAVEAMRLIKDRISEYEQENKKSEGG